MLIADVAMVDGQARSGEERAETPSVVGGSAADVDEWTSTGTC